MKIKLELTEQEAILVRDALTDKRVGLRTIHLPKEKVLSEQEFLNSDITEKRRENYFSVCDVINMINARIK